MLVLCAEPLFVIIIQVFLLHNNRLICCALFSLFSLFYPFLVRRFSFLCVVFVFLIYSFWQVYPHFKIFLPLSLYFHPLLNFSFLFLRFSSTFSFCLHFIFSYHLNLCGFWRFVLTNY